MTAARENKPVTIAAIKGLKGQRPIVCLTAYTCPMARLLDDHVDLLLVGDSLGMTLYGMKTTLEVTLEMMIAHGQAVMRGASKACVVVDMPFGSFQESKEAAFRACARVMKKTGCAGVKLEGGAAMAETIEYLTKRGVPVMGHVGMLPQSVNITGGYRFAGREKDEAKSILADAKAVAKAGAFALVAECVVEPLAKKIAKAIPIPVIGIGASPACDGQILVTEDLVGLAGDFKPRFAKRYGDAGQVIAKAAEDYAKDVRARRFPAIEHCFGVKPGGDGH